jgi:hypothetical protein
MIPAGRYDFGLGAITDYLNHGLELDAQFVDLVGATGVREDVVLTSAIAIASRGTVEQTADDVKISFLTMEITSASSAGSGATEAAAYFPTTALANAVLSDVICQSENPYNVYSMRRIEYAGTYTRVAGGTNSFGTTASGTFTDCTGGEDAFGGSGTASGTFLRCVAGSNSFGVYGTASGTFTDCVAGGWGFGSSGTASGTFLRCVAGSSSFGETTSGTFTDCVGGSGSFGQWGTVDAGAVFIRCHGADTHMNTGKTRLCYDASNNLIDNSGEFINEMATIAGAKTFSGQVEATGQAATTDDSLMTRHLSVMEQLFTPRLRRITDMYSFLSSGAGSSAGAAFGTIKASCGSAAAGYGKANVTRTLTSNPAFTGGSTAFSEPVWMALSLTLIPPTADAGRVRITFGDNGTAPPAADAAPLTTKGYGAEIYYSTANSRVEIRAFSYDSSLSYSAGVAFPAIYTSMVSLIIGSDAAGNVKVYTGIGTNQSVRPTLAITHTGVPTSGVWGEKYLTISQVAPSGVAPVPTNQSLHIDQTVILVGENP